METPRNGPAEGASVARLLSKDLIRIHLVYSDKNGLMEYLMRELCAVKALENPRLLREAMLKRESEGIATTLDTGLSLPHARIAGLKEVFAILGLLATPLADPRQADAPIRGMLLFFSPDLPEATSRHLYLLRSIALLFQDVFLDELVKAGSPEQALLLIQQREASLRGI